MSIIKRDPPEKSDPLCPAFHGQSRSFEPTWNDPPTANVP